MAFDPLNRRLALLASAFAFLGVILGGIALGTNYWTSMTDFHSSQAFQNDNGTTLFIGRTNQTWNGLFYRCNNRDGVPCRLEFLVTTFILCLLGLIFLLVSGIFLCWDLFQMSDRRFVIPMIVFLSCVLLTSGLVDYGSMNPLNSHSSRTMITALVFAYSVLPISAFIAGRHSTLNQFVNNGNVNNGEKYLSTSNGN